MYDVTIQELLTQYQGRIRELQGGFEQARFEGALSALLLAIALVLFLALGLLAVRQQISFLWPPAPVTVAAASARRLRKCRRSQSRMWRLRRFYARAVQRLDGSWAGGGNPGDEFNSPGHPYAADLNIFGEGSLFELLCTARTAIGRRGLAEYLLKTPAVEETLLRQDAVRELRENTGLRERLGLLGDFESSQSSWESFDEWLGRPRVSFSGFARIALLCTSAAVAGLATARLAGLIPWSTVALWIAPLLGFHAIVGLLFRRRVSSILAFLRPASMEVQVLREGLRLLEEGGFQSLRLRQLGDKVRDSSKALRKLERLLNAMNERTKDWFYGPSLLLALGTQLAMAMEDWRASHSAELRIWLGAWAEFEALNTLANYAYENPGNAFPEFSHDGTQFEAEGLGHPLIRDECCVRNDIRLGRDARFYIVSGSNMSGKSTLLRAIGLNAVLASAGAPVRARMLRLSRLSVFASFSVVDSLLSGKSKFMAEVDRIRRMIQAAMAGEPVLFLIDEILAGTNSRDRRAATEAVVRTLVGEKAIGAICTHDLALCGIATSELGGVNVHTGSRDGSDPLEFDYVLKLGVTTESNALAIARMAGVPV